MLEMLDSVAIGKRDDLFTPAAALDQTVIQLGRFSNNNKEVTKDIMIEHATSTKDYMRHLL